MGPPRMSAGELRVIMREMGVTRLELAPMIGRSYSAVKNWAAGVVAIPLPMGMLIRMVRDEKIEEARSR